jgi:hypothetical protein
MPPPNAHRWPADLADDDPSLRARLRAYGWTHAALAERLKCDRSRVSHALAPGGEELPPRQLIQSIADALDAHAAAQGLRFQPLATPTMSRWYQARQARAYAETREGRERRRAATKQTDGAPPASMDTYADLLNALNALIAEGSDPSGRCAGPGSSAGPP